MRKYLIATIFLFFTALPALAGTVAFMYRGGAVALPETETRFYLNELSKDVIAYGDTSAVQGVAFDGTYHYFIRTNVITKMTYSGGAYTEVLSRDISADPPAAKSQNNGTIYHDGYLWISANNYAATAQGWIVRYDPTDLTYVDHRSVEAHWCEGGAFRDGEFWAVYHDWPYASRYAVDGSGNFTHIGDYLLPLSEGETTSLYQGVAWFGDYLITNLHNENIRAATHIHKWSGSSFAASEIVTAQNGSGQGLHWETTIAPTSGDTILLARRASGDDGIIRAELHEQVFTGANLYADAILADSPVIFWRLNEGGGVTLRNYANMLNWGTYLINATSGAAFNADTSAASGVFAATQAGSVRHLAEFSGWTDLSVEASFNATDTTDVIIAGKHHGSTSGEWYLGIVSGNLMFTTVNAASSRDDFATGIAITAGVDYHVVATYDGTTKKVYLNAGAPAEKITSQGALKSYGVGVSVGAIGNTLATWRFSGRIGDVSIYNSVLSPAQIAAHYSALSSE